MLVRGIRRILHDADVHRLADCYSYRLSGLVIDEPRGTLEENIVRTLEDIELAERLQRVVAAAPPPPGGVTPPAPPPPRQPHTLLGRLEVAVLTDEKGVQPLRGAVGLLVGCDLVAVGEVVEID